MYIYLEQQNAIITVMFNHRELPVISISFQTFLDRIIKRHSSTTKNDTSPKPIYFQLLPLSLCAGLSIPAASLQYFLLLSSFIRTISSLCFSLVFSLYLLNLFSNLFWGLGWKFLSTLLGARFIIIQLMSKYYIVAYCLKQLVSPQLYLKQAYFLKKQAQFPTLIPKKFVSEDDAKQFLADKMKEFQINELQNRLNILRNNLEPEISAPTPKKDNAEKEQFIDPQVRAQRQKEVNNIFLQYNFFKKTNYVSYQAPVVPTKVYEGFFDGGAVPNPGLSAVGYLIKCDFRDTIIRRGQFIGVKRTNNQAENIGLGLLMAEAYCNGINKINIFGDSNIAISFMTGKMKVNDDYLFHIVQGNLNLAKKFEKIQFQHIKRMYNTECDKLAGFVLTEYKKKVQKQKRYQLNKLTNNQHKISTPKSQ